MLDDIGREDDAEAFFGGELAHDEIFGEVILENVEAADGVEGLAARGDGGSQREAHAFEHPGSEDAAHEFGVKADGFEQRPETAAGDGAIWAGGETERGVLKFGGESAQHVGGNADVAIGHDDQVVAGACKHSVEAEDLGVGVRRFACEQKLRGNLREFPAKAFDDRDSGVGWLADGEKDFEVWVILCEDGTEVLLKAVIDAGEGFENADRRESCESGRAD